MYISNCFFALKPKCSKCRSVLICFSKARRFESGVGSPQPFLFVKELKLWNFLARVLFHIFFELFYASLPEFCRSVCRGVACFPLGRDPGVVSEARHLTAQPVQYGCRTVPPVIVVAC